MMGLSMKTDIEAGLVNDAPSQRSVTRRRFLESAASVGAMGMATNAWAQAGQGAGNISSGDLRLPDGTEFVRWEQPLTFSKTYYVDNGSANADDNGPGDRARPFRTMNKAAPALPAGDRGAMGRG